MEKLLFEYLCQLERVLPTVRAQEVVDTNTFRVECWVALLRIMIFISVTLPTASGCSKLDSAGLFRYFFCCFAPVWYGHGVAISR